MAGAAERRTGRCNCDAVRFAALGPFRPGVACHCKTCRRQSSHFLVATEVARAGLALEGEEALSWFHATAQARRGFCRHCGVHLFWEEHGSERISILMGCLDDPVDIPIARHIFVAEKGDYYAVADGLPVS